MALSQWVSLMLVTVLVVSSGMVKNNLPTIFQPIDIFLYVDTTSDFSDAAHQACTAHSMNDCSLRGAITRANRDLANHYIIQVRSATYNLSLSGEDDTNEAGDLDISGNVDISRSGPLHIAIDANQIDRVFHIQPGAQVAISMITIRNGLSFPSQGGGGIYNAGNLSLEDVDVRDNRSGNGLSGGDGGPGGGILNTGILSMQHCNVIGNHAGAGGDGSDTGQYGCDDCDGGEGGNGGGIANFGQIHINNWVYLIGNHAGAGGNGGQGTYYYRPQGGDGGDGGGLYNSGTLIADNVSIRENETGNAGIGGRGYWPSVFGNGVPGEGGGVYNTAYIKMSRSQIIGNTTAQAIKHFNFESGGSYSGGHGGGVYNAIQAVLTSNNVIISANQSSGMGGGIFNAGRIDLNGRWISQNNARQGGGGVYNNGRLIASQVAIIENITGPGYDGFQIQYPSPGGSFPQDGESPGGGGMMNAGDARLNNVQINDNVAGVGGNGSAACCGIDSSDGGDGGSGGGLYNLAELAIDLSTIQGNRSGKGGEGGRDGCGGCQDGLDGIGGSGAGIYNAGNLSAAYLTILDNQTDEGFSTSQPGGMGGGLANLGNMTLGNSLVQGNQTSAGGSGGGIYLGSQATNLAAVAISNTEVISNTSGADGGGVYANGREVNLDNVVVAGNGVTEGGSGNGLFLANGQAQVRHLTLAGNTPEIGSGISVLTATVSLTNSIIAGQKIGISAGDGALVDMQATLWGADSWANQQDWAVNGTLVTCTLNLHADPLFADPTKMDFHLGTSSPAIDAGIATSLAVDMDNQPRPNPSTNLPDIGADEVWTLTSVADVEIHAPELITATVPATLTASIQPLKATPLVSYIWFPEPLSGQGTAEAVYAFDEYGAQAVTVFAINAGNQVSATQMVDVQPLWRLFYLPMISKP